MKCFVRSFSVSVFLFLCFWLAVDDFYQIVLSERFALLLSTVDSNKMKTKPKRAEKYKRPQHLLHILYSWSMSIPIIICFFMSLRCISVFKMLRHSLYDMRDDLSIWMQACVSYTYVFLRLYLCICIEVNFLMKIAHKW